MEHGLEGNRRGSRKAISPTVDYGEIGRGGRENGSYPNFLFTHSFSSSFFSICCVSAIC